MLVLKVAMIVESMDLSRRFLVGSTNTGSLFPTCPQSPGMFVDCCCFSVFLCAGLELQHVVREGARWLDADKNMHMSS